MTKALYLLPLMLTLAAVYGCGDDDETPPDEVIPEGCYDTAFRGTYYCAAAPASRPDLVCQAIPVNGLQLCQTCRARELECRDSRIDDKYICSQLRADCEAALE